MSQQTNPPLPPAPAPGGLYSTFQWMERSSCYRLPLSIAPPLDLPASFGVCDPSTPHMLTKLLSMSRRLPDTPQLHNYTTDSRTTLEAQNAVQLCEGLSGWEPPVRSTFRVLSSHSTNCHSQHPPGRYSPSSMPLHIHQAAHRLEHPWHSYPDIEQCWIEKGGPAIPVALHISVVTEVCCDQGGRSHFD